LFTKVIYWWHFNNRWKDNEINYVINKLKGKYKISKESNTNKIIGINIYKTINGYKINQIDFINRIIKKV